MSQAPGHLVHLFYCQFSGQVHSQTSREESEIPNFMNCVLIRKSYQNSLPNLYQYHLDYDFVKITISNNTFTISVLKMAKSNDCLIFDKKMQIRRFSPDRFLK